MTFPKCLKSFKLSGHSVVPEQGSGRGRDFVTPCCEFRELGRSDWQFRDDGLDEVQLPAWGTSLAPS